MLSQKEKYVMEYVYQQCTGKKSKLISPREIVSFAADKYVLYPKELDQIMTNLSFDNYIDLVRSDKLGEPVFVVSLKMKGEGFHRELSNAKRTTLWLLGRTIILAVIGSIITLVVKAIIG